MTFQYISYRPNAGGGGSSGITSINGNTATAQVIQGDGTNTLTNSSAGTTTIHLEPTLTITGTINSGVSPLNFSNFYTPTQFYSFFGDDPNVRAYIGSQASIPFGNYGSIGFASNHNSLSNIDPSVFGFVMDDGSNDLFMQLFESNPTRFLQFIQLQATTGNTIIDPSSAGFSLISKTNVKSPSLIAEIGTGGLGPNWLPTVHQGSLQLTGDNSGNATDFGVISFSKGSNAGPAPLSRGTVQWVNNDPGLSPANSASSIISTLRYDGTSGGTSGKWVFSNNLSLGTTPVTDFLEVSTSSGGNYAILNSTTMVGGNTGIFLNCFGQNVAQFYYFPPFGTICQLPTNIYSIDGGNTGTFGGLTATAVEAWKYNFMGNGGLAIGCVTTTWFNPPNLLYIQGQAAASFGQYVNTATGTGGANGFLSGITSAGAAQLLHQGAFALQLGVSGTPSYQVTASNILQNMLSANEATGAGTALLGTNSPAVTNTAPYTWIKMISSDGSTVYVPAFK